MNQLTEHLPGLGGENLRAIHFPVRHKQAPRPGVEANGVGGREVRVWRRRGAVARNPQEGLRVVDALSGIQSDDSIVAATISVSHVGNASQIVEIAICNVAILEKWGNI